MLGIFWVENMRWEFAAMGFWGAYIKIKNGIDSKTSRLTVANNPNNPPHIHANWAILE